MYLLYVSKGGPETSSEVGVKFYSASKSKTCSANSIICQSDQERSREDIVCSKPKLITTEKMKLLAKSNGNSDSEVYTSKSAISLKN